MTRTCGAIVVMIAAAVFGPACKDRGAAPPAAPGATAAASPATAAAVPSIACAAEPSGLAPLLHAGALIVFGEVHGTAETPAFVANAACHAAQTGREVAVGLEVPRDLQPQLDRFLDSNGGPDDVAALLAGEHWNAEDGTASKALFDIVEHVRSLRHTGHRVRAFFFDMAKSDGGDRDQNMAASIAAQVERNASGITLILTGNMHARTDTERWMSWHIAQHHRELVTLNVSYPRGSAYMCIMGGECGIHSGLKGKDRGPSPFIEVFPAPDAAGYHGVFYLGAAVTASPPVNHKGPVKMLELPSH
jgi:hypothetical protein